MAGNIWVLAEQWKGQVSEVTYESLALGRELASALGVKLEAVLLGQNAKGLAGTLGAADAVLVANHATLAEPVPETNAAALEQLIQKKQPQAVLIPLTNVTLGVAGILAAKLDVPCINFCVDAKVDGGKIQTRCVLYGGKMEVLVAPAGKLCLLCTGPGIRPAEKGRVDKAPAIEEVALTLPDAPRVRFKKYIAPAAGDVDVTQQAVLVAVGRGIQSKDNVGLAEEIAQVLGGAVCGSRPVVDQGWLPLTRQVGKSGATVKPKLYLAAGISGAPEHVEGMKNAGLIIAINSDAQAPIFNVAHYGIVGDALEVLPALKDAVAARKG